MATLIDNLFAFNDWANARILKLAHGLSAEQLDHPRTMGFGSLRNTIFHILAAEEIWCERWSGDPWRPFEVDAADLSLDAIGHRMQSVAVRRSNVLKLGRDAAWKQHCSYKNQRGDSFSHTLDELLLHVANHGIHHRAQALNFLRHAGITVPGGLDYIFFRLAHPRIRQKQEVESALRQFGLEIATDEGGEVEWNEEIVRKYFAYGDWANIRGLALMDGIDDSALDRAWDIGMGSIRKNALHILDAERWWIRNWTEGPSSFEKLPETTSVERIKQLWSDVVERRNAFIASLNPESAKRVVEVIAGGPAVRVMVIESLLQLCGHGTHHRAQLVNMLRQTLPSNRKLPEFDVIFWMREKSG
jgi:uncharacterized damage-inducible protein DinB